MPQKKKKRKKINPRVLHQVLKNIYLDPKHPGSFASPYRVYKHAVKVNRDITLEDVEKWLEGQDAYTLHRQVMLKFPRRKVVTPAVGYQYQADLVDYHAIHKDNDKTKFLLTIIDCFSRYALALPLKSKTGKEVCEALKTAFRSMGKPVKFQTDHGGEFYNVHVKKLLEDLNIEHFSTDQELKAQIVERFNRTLREKIQKYLVSRKTLRYINVLPDILFGYNARIHGSLEKFAPREVNKKNEEEVHKIQFADYLAQKPRMNKFKINDTVRITKYRDKFSRTHHKNFTEEVFWVIDILNTFPPTYKLRDKNNEIITGIFYEPQMQRVKYDRD